MLKMRGNKGMSISAFILVLTFFALGAACLIAFILRADGLGKEINSASIGKIYVVSDSINYYISDIISSFDAADESEFIAGFSQGLSRYKTNGEYIIPQLAQVESQLDLGHVIILDGKILFTPTIKIEGEASKGVYASYTYTKSFEKQITQNI